jgi:hypothetical protein
LSNPHDYILLSCDGKKSLKQVTQKIRLIKLIEKLIEMPVLMKRSNDESKKNKEDTKK